MTIRNFVGLLIALFVLAGCVSTTPSPISDPTIPPLRVHLSPDLSFLEPILSSCKPQAPKYELILVKEPQHPTDPSAADLIIRWGIPGEVIPEPENDVQTYRLADVPFSIIAHPDRTLPILSASTLVDIFQGKIQNWSVISSDTEPGAIQPVMYPTDHPLRRMFQSVLFPQGSLASNARIAPHPEAVIKVVSEHSGAIGFIPDPYRTNAIQIVSISSTLDTYTQPLWGLQADISNPQAETLLACITETLQD